MYTSQGQSGWLCGIVLLICTGFFHPACGAFTRICPLQGDRPSYCLMHDIHKVVPVESHSFLFRVVAQKGHACCCSGFQTLPCSQLQCTVRAFLHGDPVVVQHAALLYVLLIYACGVLYPVLTCVVCIHCSQLDFACRSRMGVLCAVRAPCSTIHGCVRTCLPQASAYHMIPYDRGCVSLLCLVCVPVSTSAASHHVTCICYRCTGMQLRRPAFQQSSCTPICPMWSYLLLCLSEEHIADAAPN